MAGRFSAVMVKLITLEPSARTMTVWASADSPARVREKALTRPTPRMWPVSGQRAMVWYSPASKALARKERVMEEEDAVVSRQ